ncbi:hypothetical protein P4O66_006217 [Electrophorus voltai]|uniref:Tumor protein p53 inducible nuclear protein 2 n=2 Tax=Electrophorus TaxID=8004 RepID=A0A4W4FBP2_ELEEL|nr:tumor protein p53-inducible nuclear protein 2 isoform X2 [Electrophorus electricus]KAK1799681.1 hypothetical protein P4O66_006217 [Electrophorus voltai]
MFQRLTDLLFGSLGSATQESAVPNSGGLEEEDEEWLLVSIPDGEPLVEVIPVPSTTSVSRSVQDANSTRVTDNLVSSNSMVDPGVPTGQGSGPVSRFSVPQARVVRVGRRQWAQTRAERFRLGHHCIQRQNCVHQRLPCPTSRTRPMILHQPGYRSFCH